VITCPHHINTKLAKKNLSAIGINEPEITQSKMSPSSLKEYFSFHTEQSLSVNEIYIQ
jgi:hypothetical protein